jgi:hypothetical protein
MNFPGPGGFGAADADTISTSQTDKSGIALAQQRVHRSRNPLNRSRKPPPKTAVNNMPHVVRRCNRVPNAAPRSASTFSSCLTHVLARKGGRAIALQPLENGKEEGDAESGSG